MLESRLGLRIVLGCKWNKIFLRAPSVFMEHRAPYAPMDTCGQHLWQLTVGRRPLGGGADRGSWRPRTRGVAPPPPRAWGTTGWAGYPTVRTRPLLDVRPRAKPTAARFARSGIPILHVPLEACAERAGRSVRVTWSVRGVLVVRALRVLKTLRATPLAIKQRLRLEMYGW